MIKLPGASILDNLREHDPKAYKQVEDAFNKKLAQSGTEVISKPKL